MRDYPGNTVYAEYDNFKVGCEQEKYKMISLGNYTGNAGQFVMNPAIISVSYTHLTLPTNREV